MLRESRKHNPTRIEVALSFVTGSFNGRWLKWDSSFSCVKMVTFVYGNGRGKWGTGLELGGGFQACALVSQLLLSERQQKSKPETFTWRNTVTSDFILYFCHWKPNIPIVKRFFFFFPPSEKVKMKLKFKLSFRNFASLVQFHSWTAFHFVICL